jgi:ferritin
MADLEQLYSALRQADAAGNTEDATKLANYIRQQQQAPQPDSLGRFVAEPATAPAQEIKTANPFKGLIARAADLAGSGVEGVARTAESIGDKLELAMPLTNLTPEQVKEENQLQTLFDFSKSLKNWSKDIGYAPSTQRLKQDAPV